MDKLPEIVEAVLAAAAILVTQVRQMGSSKLFIVLYMRWGEVNDALEAALKEAGLDAEDPALRQACRAECERNRLDHGCLLYDHDLYRLVEERHVEVVADPEPGMYPQISLIAPDQVHFSNQPTLSMLGIPARPARRD